MAMKMASIFCGAVVVLLLVAGRAGAQSDSSLLELRSFAIVPDTEFTWTVGDTSSGTRTLGTKAFDYNYSINIPRNDTIDIILGNSHTIQFEIDTVARLIRNLK